jgi:hypothetical protein
VLSGAAGIELDQSSNATVIHTEISGGVQNGGINLDCHGDCHPTMLTKNHLFDLGTHNRFGLSSDGGAVHVDNSTGFVELSNNKVHDIRAQGSNGGGLYLDDHTTNVYAHGNLWYNLRGGVVQWNRQAAGGTVNITNNVWIKSNNGSYSEALATEHFFEMNRNGAVNFSNNIFYYDSVHDGLLYTPSTSRNTYGQEFVAEKNLYFDTESSTPGVFAQPRPFPGGLTWKEWQASGKDVASTIGDPKFEDHSAENFNFSTTPGTPAANLGILPLDVDDAGPNW